MAFNSAFVFNEAYYRAQNPDVAAAIGVLQPDGVTLFTSGKQHFDAYGAAEGRVASPLFNATVYAANNPDLAEAGITTEAQLRAHWSTYGAAEGRIGVSSQVFNLEYYKANNQDLVDLGLTDAQITAHFYEYGAAEGRAATENFSVAAYKAANPDLAGLTDSVARGHWYTYGAFEGRAFPQLAQSFTLTQSATQVSEGSAITYTITSALPVTADTSFTYNVTGDTNGGTIDAAVNADFNGVSGSVSISAGSTSVTFTITPTLDTTLEGLEGFKVTVFNSLLAVVGSKTGIIIDNSQNAPQNFTLTSSADSVTGGAAADTVTATLSSASTLTAGDVINLGGGADTVNLSITGTPGTVSSVTLTGVETLNVSAFETAAVEIDGTLFSSALTAINQTSSGDSADTKFSNLNGLVSASMASGKGDLALTYASSVVSGAADTQNLTVTNTGTGSKFAVNGVETIALTSNGTSTNVIELDDSADATLAKVTVSGANAIELTANDDKVKTFDASAATGKVTFKSDNTGIDYAITGGSGNDTFTLSETALTKADIIAGGAGVDKLTVSDTSVADADLAGLSSIESLAFGGASIDLTLGTKAVAAGIATVTGTTGNDVVTLTAVDFTSALTVAVSTGKDKVVNSANVALTVTAAASAIDGSDTLTGGTGTDTLTLTADGGSAALSANVTGFEVINLVADGTNTIALDLGDDAVIAAKSSLTINGSALTAAATVDASDISTNTKSVVITTGAGADTIDGGAGNDSIVSGAGADDVGGGAGADTIDGGAGNDTIDGEAGNDSLIGGDGDDSIVTGAGNDTVNAGAGNDTINVGSNLASGDSIDGGDGIDTLVVSGSITASVLSGVTNVEALSLTGGGSSATLAAALSGITTIDLSDTTAQTLTLDTGYTGVASVKLTGDTNGKDAIVNTANATLVVTANAGDILSTVSITGGTGTDTLTLTADGSSANLSAVTGVDGITIVDGGDAATGTAGSGGTLLGDDVTITLGSYATAISIDAAALDGNTDSTKSETLTLNGGSATKNITVIGGGGNDTITTGSGNDSVTGGDGADSITSGSGDDNLSGGAGNDRFVVSSFDAKDTIVGGDGTDTLVISSTVTDSGVFANVSGVEILELSGATDVTLLTGAGSFTTVKQATGSANVITFAVGYTAATTVDITGHTTDADKLVNAAGIALTVTGNAKDFVATTTITGGTGTDSLKITADKGTSVFTNITSVESVTLLDGTDGGETMTLDLGSYATAVSINGSALVGALTLTGGSATKNVTVTGGAGADGLTTGAGNDSISAGAGADTITSGTGNDIVLGGAGADSIDAGAGNDSIDGGDGADTIIGGAGSDTMTGGAGADRFIFVDAQSTSVSTDTITDFVTGTDTLELQITLTSGKAASFSHQGNAVDTSTGLTLLSSKTGESYFNTTTSQFVVDLNGDGLIQSSDLVVTLSGATKVDSTSIYYNITGTAGNDTVTGSANGDSISGLAGNDSISGAAGNDTIDAGAGDDTVAGGDGNDSIAGGADNDSISGDAGDDSIDGGAGNDSIDGGAGNDSLVGGAGNDTILGGAGVDTITSGTGADSVTGGAGLDTFIIAAGDTSVTIGGTGNSGTIAGFDTITDFTLGSGSANSETLDVAGTATIATTTAGTDGTDSTLTIGGNAIKSHAIAASGLITFDDADTFAAAVSITSDANVAAVIEYLQANDIGTTGSTVFFTDGTNTWVFTQGSADGTTNADDVVVKLTGVLADTLITTNGTGANDLFIS
ncbi:hypothetical protein IP70_21520 [alpha proteobacterium AAP38]|nr:hypothetical protein IP70_21520 [alpha proteobacterium AAP38]